LQIEKLLKQNNFVLLNDIDCSILHPAEIKREFVENGEWFFRTQNLRPLKIESSNDVFISSDDAKILTKNNIYFRDILITRTGANYGQTAIYDLQKPTIASSHILILRNTVLNQFYIAIFFNTKYGKKMIDKGVYGAAQPEISPYYLLNIPIPKFSINFQKKIENIYCISVTLNNKTKAKYIRAETLLLDALNLANSPPTAEKVNIKSFKDSFVKTGRLDAEYYQKKYEDYNQHIISYVNGWQSLSKICEVKDFNCSPKDNKEYKYIELANINNSGGIMGCTIGTGKNLPSRARRKIEAGDVLVSSIEGSLASCAIVPKAFSGALCSTGFYVVSSKQINSETLLVLFKCELLQNILKQNCSGTILTAINKTEFLNIPLPIIDRDTQTRIASLIQENFNLKVESERLLETAKKAVEIAIEQDEQAAIKFLTKETGENLS
jgi:type I restriction enzyme S subunit